MNKKLLLFCSGVMLSTSLWAQTKTVTGKVTNASDGGSMANVTVSIKGKPISTQTNPDGSFTIKADPGDILIFRAVGSKERQQLVGSDATINIVLSGSEEALEEVVVTAMGIKKEKKALGYAVQDIKADELMKNKTANVVNSLAGKIAGVNVTQASGAAGAGAQIILRGGPRWNGIISLYL
ncbi:carboxypeptidase-like regulatory domain-containing protein [Sphingobacterium thalpophilum]|uniref:Outer membrane receptor for ferrienterochelin and colicins n=1 Tax=Sphingobacterium thalpophilum TaxID=259 RepID=A0A4V6KT83_9SPHI|nr:carboxypeptidase-like regulatory domain-containing protein [Sphingobacterium thalpophilum]VTR37588.1 Outer membrane receptor for ferrienterochelin and colicins [Sphingobacterium thalpophilum]